MVADPPASFSRRGGGCGRGRRTAVGVDRAFSSSQVAPVVPRVALGSQPAGLPARQHAWGATLASDVHGNPTAPRFDRLLFFDVEGGATPASARLLEAALRTLERRYRWGPDGLLFTAGWGPSYFERVLRVRIADPARQGPVGVRAARDRQLRPVPAPCL